MDINVNLLQWFIIFLIKNSYSSIKKEIMHSEELGKELHKLIIRKFEKRKVH